MRYGIAIVETSAKAQFLYMDERFAEIVDVSIQGGRTVDVVSLYALVTDAERKTIRTWLAGHAAGDSLWMQSMLAGAAEKCHPVLLNVQRLDEDRARVLLVSMEDTIAESAIADVMLGTLPCGFYICAVRGDDENPDIRLQSVNEALLAMTGVTAEVFERAVAQKDGGYFDAGDWQRVTEAGHRAAQMPGTPVDVQPIRATFAGQRRIFLLSIVCRRMEAGVKTFFCTMQDITYGYSANEQLHEQTLRYNRVAAATGEYLSDYTVRDDTLVLSIPSQDGTTTERVIAGYFEGLASRGTVHPDDIEKLRNVFQKSVSMPVMETVDIRSSLFDGRMRWNRVQYAGIADARGTVYRIVGRIWDIDQQREAEQKLRVRAEHDALTGLYNRGTTQDMINQALAQENERHSEAKHALLMIDVDNFKQLNDRLSHTFGDAVLSELASSLQRAFRADDIVGRIGGDEFVAFVRNVDSLASLFGVAKRLCDRLQHVYEVKDGEIQISISIGIALYPEHGRDYDALFHAADIANYHAKAHGKNRYYLYAGENTMNYRNQRPQEDLEPKGNQMPFRENLERYLLRILYDGEERLSTVNAALELLSHHFGMQRAYVMRYSDEHGISATEHSWYDTRYVFDYEALEGIDPALMDAYYHEQDEQGRLVLKTMDALPAPLGDAFAKTGAYSMIQYKYNEMGKLRGLIGFDNCAHPTLALSDEQIESLIRLSRILVIYALQGAPLSRSTSTLSLSDMLDHLPTYAYIIDRNDHSIQHANRAFMHRWPQTTTHSLCYKTIFGREAPCEDCPMRRLDDKNPQDRVSSLIENESGGLVIKVTASWLARQNKKPLCLFNAVDISEYAK